MIFQLQDGAFLFELLYSQKINAVFSKFLIFNPSGKTTPLAYQNSDPNTGEPLIVIPSGFATCGKRDFFLPAHCDTLFEITNRELKPFLSLGLSKILFPKEATFNSSLYEQVNGNTILRVRILGLNSDNILVRFNYRGKNYQAIANISSGESEVFWNQESEYINDLDRVVTVKSLNNYHPLSKMIHLPYQAIDIKGIADAKHSQLGPSFLKMVNKMNIDDNPIIVNLQMKELIVLNK